MADRPGRRRAEKFGRRGELAAAFWLSLSAYRIRARRVRTPVGEIDLMASRGHALAFIEVKARSTVAERDRALAAVNRSRIVSAAQWWIARHPHYAGWPMRFDIIGLAPFSLPRHVKGAFDATDHRGNSWL
ncbi:MAG TPA: YraN family protein [Devosiaceae bacterium]|nr:YraN family protein [Devosiaceae bacterium]